MNAATLSVVVVPVDGYAAVEGCLRALRAQRDAPTLEIVVPFDDTLADLHGLRDSFPEVRFLALGALLPGRDGDDYSAQHERIDRRRAAGIAASTGEVVALLEDRGHPSPGWARTIVEAQTDQPGVVGGLIELGVDRALHRAVFLIDFAPYAPPRAAAEVTELSDINVSYSRRALEATRRCGCIPI